LKVLVTGAAWKIGMAVISSLSKEGFTIVGTDERPLPFRLHSRHLKSYYTHSNFSNEKFYENIVSIIEKERPDVLIPIGGTKQISLHKNEISKYVNVLVPNYESYSNAYDKKKTYEMCRETGIDVPKRFTDVEANLMLKNRENSRLVIKPDYDIGGAKGLSFVSNVEELNSARKNIQNTMGNFVIEEFIPGASRMRTIQLLFDKNNKLIAHFILKKIHQWPITGGNTAYAESTHELELLEFVMPFFKKCLWEGPAAVQLIIDERDNKPKLIEINPRYAGSLAFPIQLGVNIPLAVCMAALNKDCRISYDYSAGEFYIHSSFFLKAVLKELGIAKNKKTFLHQVFDELRQKKVSVLLDKKDFPVYLSKALIELKNMLF
jgi:predicted ATP-grasp superfamily ATP-dependent carboligase